MNLRSFFCDNDPKTGQSFGSAVSVLKESIEVSHAVLHAGKWMKNIKVLGLGFALVIVSGCTVTPSKHVAPPVQGASPFGCGFAPATEGLWTDGYNKMSSATIDPDWAGPIYEGFGTAAWVLATPLYVVADLLTSPLRIAQPCPDNPTPVNQANTANTPGAASSNQSAQSRSASGKSSASQSQSRRRPPSPSSSSSNQRSRSYYKPKRTPVPPDDGYSAPDAE